MAVVLTFAIAGVIAVLATAVTVAVLRPHLLRLLDELCGSRGRASFWLVVSLLTIAICGVLSGTATYGYPDQDQAASSQDVFLGALTQLRPLLIGLLGSVLLVAWVVGQGIRGFERRADRRAYYAAIQASPPPPPTAAPAAPAAAPSTPPPAPGS
jgi:hypothetical protein